jgi:Lon protease-like protein
MLKNPFDISFEALPDSLPIFPLRDVLLLPGGQIPLNVFEPRYLNMVQDALSAKDRLIGVVSPKDPPQSGDKKIALSSVGCAGRITSFEEKADGRFMITLTGYCRFHVKKEITTMRGYRRFNTDWTEFERDLTIDIAAGIDKDRLVQLLESYAELAGIEMDWGLLSRMPSFNIVTFFSMTLPLSQPEKQQLLATPTITERAELLMEMIQEQVLEMKRKHRD